MADKLPERKLFMTISGIGKVDERNKLVYSKGYKRMIAQRDRPLQFLAEIAERIIIPEIGYSSKEAAAADLAEFKEWAAGIEINQEVEQKFDLEKQERVCIALWELARNQQRLKHNCTSGDGTTAHTPSIGKAIERIMDIFGYGVIEIQ